MNKNWAANGLTAVVFCLCGLALASGAARAGDKGEGKEKIKELQKQRLKAATKARDYLMEQYKQGYRPPNSDSTNHFFQMLLDTNKLVFQARLDLCDGKPARLKAIAETIKEIEPFVALLEQQFKTSPSSATALYQMARAHLLELKIALEKAKGERKEKIKELQKQRLKAATKARDFLMTQDQGGYLRTRSWYVYHIVQLLEANKLVFQAQLDLCDGKPARLKAIAETIKEIEPFVDKLEQQFKVGVATTRLTYNLTRAHLLELQIALEKAKQELGGK